MKYYIIPTGESGWRVRRGPWWAMPDWLRGDAEWTPWSDIAKDFVSVEHATETLAWAIRKAGIREARRLTEQRRLRNDRPIVVPPWPQRNGDGE